MLTMGCLGSLIQILQKYIQESANKEIDLEDYDEIEQEQRPRDFEVASASVRLYLSLSFVFFFHI